MVVSQVTGLAQLGLEAGTEDIQVHKRTLSHLAWRSTLIRMANEYPLQLHSATHAMLRYAAEVRALRLIQLHYATGILQMKVRKREKRMTA